MSCCNINLNNFEVNLTGEGAIIDVCGKVMSVKYCTPLDKVALALNLVETNTQGTPIANVGRYFTYVDFTAVQLPDGQELTPGQCYDLPFCVKFIYVGDVCEDKDWALNSRANYVCGDLESIGF